MQGMKPHHEYFIRTLGVIRPLLRLHLHERLIRKTRDNRGCSVRDLKSKSLRENYRAKNSIIEKKRNDPEIASIFTNKIKPVPHDVLSNDTLVCLQLTICTNHASH